MALVKLAAFAAGGAVLGGGALLPVHWGTFDLGLHPWSEPLETLTAGAAAASMIASLAACGMVATRGTCSRP